MPKAVNPEPTSGAVTDLVQLAREMAYDRYIQALLIKPKRLRTDFLVLAAFHGELARIPLLVSEPMMGEIRLQWWRDMVAATEFMADETAADFGSPLANHVADLIARYPAARQAFLTAIDARSTELDEQAFANQTDFENYLDGVGGALLGVNMDVLGGSKGVVEHDALRVAGRAVACADLALRLPRLASLGRLPKIPLRPRKTGSSEAPEASQHRLIFQAIKELGEQARASVTDYRDLQPRLSTQMTQAMLPLALVEPYFKSLQRGSSTEHWTFSPKSPLARFVTLWWAAKRDRF